MASSFLNGKRAVVAPFVIRVVFSLLPHGLALSLLAFSALLLDVIADSDSSDLLSRFQTRRGASSGVLLGAVTWPTVMISKLIQLSRAFAIGRVSYQEVESLSMQYWAVSASSLSMLIFLCLTLWCASENKPLSSSRCLWLSIFSCIVLHTAVCCVERILLQKYYHLIAVSMFVPALIFQPKFLNLAFGAALAIFLALEIVRVWRIWPLGQFIHNFMSAFIDHRDSNLLIVSHFSLLLGCAVPIWLSSGNNDRPLSPYSGILSLGIGDTMASVVGHK